MYTVYCSGCPDVCCCCCCYCYLGQDNDADLLKSTKSEYCLRINSSSTVKPTFASFPALHWQQYLALASSGLVRSVLPKVLSRMPQHCLKRSFNIIRIETRPLAAAAARPDPEERFSPRGSQFPACFWTRFLALLVCFILFESRRSAFAYPISTDWTKYSCSFFRSVLGEANLPRGEPAASRHADLACQCFLEKECKAVRLACSLFCFTDL